jgi:hypothetical protein
MAFKQEVNVALLLTIGVISALMVLVIVIGMQAWYQSEEINEFTVKSQEASERALSGDAPDTTLAELQEGQKLALDAKPHWVDATKKDKVAIPIKVSMEYLESHGGNLP